MENILDSNGGCVLRLYFAVSFYLYYHLLGHTFGVRIETDFRRDLFQHIQELSYAYFDNARVGQLMSQLTSELFDITEFAHHAPEDIFISTVTIIGALIIMFTIQWKLALVIAITIPIFLLIVWKCRFSMQNASRNVKKRWQRLIPILNPDFPDFELQKLLQMRTKNSINSILQI